MAKFLSLAAILTGILLYSGSAYAGTNTEHTTAPDVGITIACVANVVVTLDAFGHASIYPPDLIAFVISDCTVTDSMISQSTFDCSDVGVVRVYSTVYDDCGNYNVCYTDVLVRDNIGPVAVCVTNVILTLDATGHAVLDPAIIDGGCFDNCDLSFSLDQTDFTCADIGTFPVLLYVDDGSNPVNACQTMLTVRALADDADCDSVSDPCDICPSGDDTIDANGDGVPDCSQELNLGDYDPTWLCGTNRILACKLRSTGSQTKCIKSDKIDDYLANGDHIGPCLECPPGALVQANPNANIPTAGEPLEVYPNPVSSGEELTIRYLNPGKSPGELVIYDVNGRRIYQHTIPGGTEFQNLQVRLPNAQPGIHFIEIVHQDAMLSALFVIE